LEYRLKRKQLPGEREKVPKESLEGIYRWPSEKTIQS
jgi:hypothetical protein